MTSPTFKPRIVEVTVGTAGALGRTWGTYVPGELPVRCAAKVTLTATSKPNQCVAKIWNLSESSLRYLELKDQVLIVRAGEGVASQIFAGDIPRGGVNSQKTGADRVTEIHAKTAGRKWSEATFSTSYPKGTSRFVALNDAARAMGAAVGFVGAAFVDLTFPGPWAFVGKARSALTELVGMTVGAWWIQVGGLVYILGPGDLMPGNVPLISPTSGLRGSPRRTDKGIEFPCTFNPSILAGGGVSVQSLAVTGLYRVKALTHDVDNWAAPWSTAVKTEKKAL